MKRIASEGFNKEKLVFIGTASLLALALYHMLVSAPVELTPSEPVSNTPPPGPLDREKLDTRVADVRFYLQEGMVNPQTGIAVNRARKNPFEPIDDYVPLVPKPEVAKGPTGIKPVAIEAPPEQPAPKPAEEKEKKKNFDEVDKVAKVDFSGVMTMGGVTYGLLKSKDGGQTIQVKEGDYLEDYKYTVAKIEKQAIWVSDEDNQLFLARDKTFDVGGSGGGEEGDEKAPKKKAPKAAAPKPAPVAAAPKPTPRPTPPVAQNNNNNNNSRNNGNQRGGSSRGNRGGNTGGNYQNNNNNNNNRGGY